MTKKTLQKRLDVLLVERGLADSIQKAAAHILAGEVHVDDQRAASPGQQVQESARVQLKSRSLKYVSRGGFKLEGALQDFGVDPQKRICLDIGSSTGGFTDCLLQHGAIRVYAADVNIDQLDWKLQNDPRVIRIKKNARELSSAELPEQVDLIVVDVSFISAAKIIRPAISLAKPSADFLILIKPQFELRREEVAPGGIVTDKNLHQKAILAVQGAAETAGLNCLETRPSRLAGAEGNQEFFLHARKSS
jgi:23S rRNA (cytidine1920-2'-O)/16S rRNA (cytidine1409-2'-O)-methyltransferase